MYKISVVIPAYNEEKSICDVVSGALRYCDEVIVVDDGSSDKTAITAARCGAKVVRHEVNRGYIEALRTGFRAASGDIIVTMDGDGQHYPGDIPRLVKPIIDGKADLVLGVRDKLTFSERIIAILTGLVVRVSDASTGFRAIRSNIAKRMKIRGLCTCGTFVLEAVKLGARVSEVRIKVRPRVYGKPRMKKKHFLQMFIVLRELISFLL